MTKIILLYPSSIIIRTTMPFDKETTKTIISRSHKLTSRVISIVYLEYCNKGIVGAPLLVSPVNILEGKVEGSKVHTSPNSLSLKLLTF